MRSEPAIDLQLASAARGGAGLRGMPDVQVLVAVEWINQILILPR